MTCTSMMEPEGRHGNSALCNKTTLLPLSLDSLGDSRISITISKYCTRSLDTDVSFWQSVMGFYNSMSKLLSLVCIYAKLRCVSSSDDGYGTEWLMYTIENGSAHIMNFSTLPDNRSWQYGNVYFNLYTRNNSLNPESLKIPEKNADIETQYFVASKDTKVLAHGWLSSGSTDWIQNQKNAYLDRYDYNVIIVDWHELAQNPVYPWAALCTRYVGKRLAKLLDSLVKSYQARAEKMHLIGHSLGAQIMGQAGMFFNKTIHRITGLDPARPLFEIPPMSDDCRLDKGDAGFVDIIHTAAGVYGYEESHGQADYYPNGGKAPQPGCSGPLAGADSCSHGRSVEFFTESIQEEIPFTSYPCNSYQEFENGQCKSNSSHMGDQNYNNSHGDYYLHTRNESKYAMGDEY